MVRTVTTNAKGETRMRITTAYLPAGTRHTSFEIDLGSDGVLVIIGGSYYGYLRLARIMGAESFTAIF